MLTTAFIAVGPCPAHHFTQPLLSPRATPALSRHPIFVRRRLRANLPRNDPRIHPPTCATSSPTPPPEKPRSACLFACLGDAIYRASNFITKLFPVWTVIASLIALQWPALFATAISPRMVTLSLSVLMLSTGLTLTLSELRYALRKPLALLFSLVACYVIMPLLAKLLAYLFALEAGLAGGLILLGIMSGGQASNLCTFIAGGDTALSVAMTTLTTVTAVGALPLLSELLLGTVIQVDSWALARSTGQIVVLPIMAGVLANRVARKAVGRMKPVLPVVGIAMVVVLILGPVAKTAGVVKGSFGAVAMPVLLLHLVGGLVGYLVPRLVGAGERVAITTGFETGFKSPALSFVLAMKHFGAVEMRVASAISIMVLAPVAALFAVLLKGRSRKVKRKRRSGDGSEVGKSVRARTRERRFRLEFADGRWMTVRYEQLGAELERARRRMQKVLAVDEVNVGDGE